LCKPPFYYNTNLYLNRKYILQAGERYGKMNVSGESCRRVGGLTMPTPKDKAMLWPKFCENLR